MPSCVKITQKASDHLIIMKQFKALIHNKIRQNELRVKRVRQDAEKKVQYSPRKDHTKKEILPDYIWDLI